MATPPKQAVGPELVLHEVIKVSDDLPSQLYKTSKDVVRVSLFRSSEAPGNLVGSCDVSVAAATGPGFQKFPLVHEGKQTAEVRLQIVSRRPDGLQVRRPRICNAWVRDDVDVSGNDRDRTRVHQAAK